MTEGLVQTFVAALKEIINKLVYLPNIIRSYGVGNIEAEHST